MLAAAVATAIAAALAAAAPAVAPVGAPPADTVKAAPPAVAKAAPPEALAKVAPPEAAPPTPGSAQALKAYYANVRALGKPPVFSGEGSTLETFLYAFELYCKSTECPPEMQVRLLTAQLPQALTMSLSLAHETTPASYDELRKRLRTRFFGRDQAAYHAESAQKIVQAAGESIDELAARLQQTVRLANATTERLNSAAILAIFTNAIRHEHTVHKLRMAQRDEELRVSMGEPRKYPTFASYVELAARHETRNPLTSDDRPVAAVAPAPGKAPPALIAAIAAAPKEPAAAVADSSQADLVRQILQALAAQKAVVPKYAGPPRDHSKTTCFNCNTVGHGSRECPQPRDDAVFKLNWAEWREAHPRADDRRGPRPADPQLAPPLRAGAAAAALKPALK
jgi:hypothetical protein